jgi:hypothetical protein
MHNKDGDPTSSPMRDPRALFTEAAVRAGLIRPGELLDAKQFDFATEIVTLCARVVDRFADPERAEDTVGDVLRARLFEL